MPIWNETVTRLIKIPSWIALGLLGLSVTASFLATYWAVDAHRERFELAELAAMQGVSSQRISFLAGELANTAPGAARRLYRSALRDAVRNTERRHEILSLRKNPARIPARMRAILRDIYHSNLRPFDVQMNRFLEQARAVLEADDAQLRPDMPPLLKLKSLGAGGLLQTQGLVYDLLRQESMTSLNRLLWLVASLWVLTLGLIILEGQLVFRPMAGRTAQNLRALDAARKDAEEEIAREAEREDKIVYMRIMGHELRTPLNSILGMSELLRTGDLPEKQAEYAAQIEQAARQMLSLVNHILDFREVEADLVRLQPAPISISEELNRVVEEFRPRAVEKGLELNCTTDADLAAYYLADGGRIRQVVTNLLANALKFTEEGAVVVRGRYAGRLGAITDNVRIEVEDTGVGVPPEFRQHIFREWRQADDTMARRYEGTGLGLAIAQRLVELMDGEIGLQSGEGRGSLFWFTLPLERISARKGRSKRRRPLADKARVDVKKAG